MKTRGDIIESGLLTGLAGGAVAGFMMAIAYAGLGIGFWFPAKLVAASVFGIRALVGGAGVVLAGLILHFAVAGALGIVHAVLTRGEKSVADVIIEGPIFGVVVWALSTFVFLPYFDPVMSERLALTPIWWFVMHLIYGLCLSQNVLVLRGLRLQGPPLTQA